jgi:hypothetical protein
MWETFRMVLENFLGRQKVPNYKHLIEEMLEAYRTTGCNISLKIHILHFHCDFFLTMTGDIRNKYGENKQHDMSTMEKCFQWKWNPTLLATEKRSSRYMQEEIKWKKILNTLNVKGYFPFL